YSRRCGWQAGGRVARGRRGDFVALLPAATGDARRAPPAWRPATCWRQYLHHRRGQAVRRPGLRGTTTTPDRPRLDLGALVFEDKGRLVPALCAGPGDGDELPRHRGADRPRRAARLDVV